jgi:hypothetical protein
MSASEGDIMSDYDDASSDVSLSETKDNKSYHFKLNIPKKYKKKVFSDLLKKYGVKKIPSSKIKQTKQDAERYRNLRLRRSEWSKKPETLKKKAEYAAREDVKQRKKENYEKKKHIINENNRLNRKVLSALRREHEKQYNKLKEQFRSKQPKTMETKIEVTEASSEIQANDKSAKDKS